MIRKLIDEYAADETGQADFALEANGKQKPICTAYRITWLF